LEVAKVDEQGQIEYNGQRAGTLCPFFFRGCEMMRADSRRRWWLRYGYALLLVAASFLLSELGSRVFSPTNLVMIYLLAVVVAAVYLGRGPSVLVAVLSVLVFDFFFVPPRLTLAVSQTEYLFTFLALFIVGLVISNLTALTREQAVAAERRAVQNAELYALSRDLAVAAGLDAIIQAVITHVSQTFGGQAAVFVPAGGGLKSYAASPGLVVSDGDLSVAERAFRDGPAAATAGGILYLPLRVIRGTVGVLGIKPSESSRQLTPDQRQLLDTFASQAALAIERAQLAEQARQAEILQATEKLQTALLHSVSHDLRTPLVSVVGALSSLQEDGDGLDPASRHSLVDNALGEAERLNRLVGDLLDMTRIEAGALKVMWEPCDVEDLIGAATEQLERRLQSRSLTIDVPPDMPLVPMDFVLMERVLVNLLDNALKYAPADRPVELAARVEGPEVRFEVADRGPGVPAADLSRMFDKFYRVQQHGSAGGTGLGLSICKGIVEAHGGWIWAQNREGGGMVISVALPLVGSGGEAG
jgi:two-component system, OmpR family, sensor histidine kinase KdpD